MHSCWVIHLVNSLVYLFIVCLTFWLGFFCAAKDLTTREFTIIHSVPPVSSSQLSTGFSLTFSYVPINTHDPAVLFHHAGPLMKWESESTQTHANTHTHRVLLKLTAAGARQESPVHFACSLLINRPDLFRPHVGDMDLLDAALRASHN